MKSRTINGVIIHHSATPNGCWVSVEDIDKDHHDKGFTRHDAFRERHNPRLLAIGYHFVIYTNGTIATGRHIDEVGSHAKAYNFLTIGVCMVGSDRFHLQQWNALREHVQLLQKQFPKARVIGHRQTPKHKRKICPGFDVEAWIARGMEPMAGHILENAQ